MSFAGIKRDAIMKINGAARAVLLAILVECNHSDNLEYKLNGKSYFLKRGQWVGSAAKIAENTGLSRQKIRTALRALNATTIVTSKLTSTHTLYTIENIDEFLVNQKEQPAHQPAHQPAYINNKEYNNNEYNNISFDEFWNCYGIKKGRAKCEMVYKRHLRSGVKHEDIMRGLRAYQQECIRKKTEQRYIKNPLTWLNGRHWEDEYETKIKPSLPSPKQWDDEVPFEEVQRLLRESRNEQNQRTA